MTDNSYGQNRDRDCGIEVGQRRKADQRIVKDATADESSNECGRERILKAIAPMDECRRQSRVADEFPDRHEDRGRRERSEYLRRCKWCWNDVNGEIQRRVRINLAREACAPHCGLGRVLGSDIFGTVASPSSHLASQVGRPTDPPRRRAGAP
jgi:hypothetical protein